MRRSTFVILALSLCAAEANAEAKYNAGLVPSVGYQPGRFAFDGAIVAAALFGEPRSSAVTYGPRLEVGTFAFENLRAVAGPSLHVPVEPLALGFAAHAGAMRDSGVFLFGLGARGLIGFRPYNHYGSYAATGGLIVGIDHWFGRGPSFMVGAQLDAMWMSLPLLALAELFRG